MISLLSDREFSKAMPSRLMTSSSAVARTGAPVDFESEPPTRWYRAIYHAILVESSGYRWVIAGRRYSRPRRRRRGPVPDREILQLVCYGARSLADLLTILGVSAERLSPAPATPLVFFMRYWSFAKGPRSSIRRPAFWGPRN